MSSMQMSTIAFYQHLRLEQGSSTNANALLKPAIESAVCRGPEDGGLTIGLRSLRHCCFPLTQSSCCSLACLFVRHGRVKCVAYPSIRTSLLLRVDGILQRVLLLAGNPSTFLKRIANDGATASSYHNRRLLDCPRAKVRRR